MDPHLLEWLTLLVRWLHVTAGVAWIGASFYFIWLDLSIRKPADRPHIRGELYAVHGGGFYHAEKFELAPPEFPKQLHWFYWEAYTTWLSGIALLTLVYYLHADSYLVKPGGLLDARQAISVSVIGLALGWWGYDKLCKSRLAQDGRKLAAVGFAALVALSAVAQWLLAPRGAWLQVGATVGTMMAGNVFFVIIPGQRKMVARARQGLPPDPEDGRRGKLRSTHNNYLTLPVLLIMVSNHYPVAYGHPAAWLLLAGIFVVGAAVRHWFNRSHSGENLWWLWPVAGAGVLALAVISRPAPLHKDPAVTWAQVEPIVAARCAPCHAPQPTFAGVAAPPLGLLLQTEAQVRAARDKVIARAVTAQDMPLANVTGITDAERATLGAWLAE